MTLLQFPLSLRGGTLAAASWTAYLRVPGSRLWTSGLSLPPTNSRMDGINRPIVSERSTSHKDTGNRDARAPRERLKCQQEAFNIVSFHVVSRSGINWLWAYPLNLVCNRPPTGEQCQYRSVLQSRILERGMPAVRIGSSKDIVAHACGHY